MPGCNREKLRKVLAKFHNYKLNLMKMNLAAIFRPDEQWQKYVKHGF